jgi:hypothetical protein
MVKWGMAPMQAIQAATRMRRKRWGTRLMSAQSPSRPLYREVLRTFFDGDPTNVRKFVHAGRS